MSARPARRPTVRLPLRVAIVGAESTGKTTLTQTLAAALNARGIAATMVPETLRLWCEREGRTPRPEEQRGIAREQACRSLLPNQASVVVVDTTALSTAVYSHFLFADTTLYDFALAHQRRYDLTLLTGLDTPWVADDQRDGPHAREPVDALLRAALLRAGLPFVVLAGAQTVRRDAALNAIFSVAENDVFKLGIAPFSMEKPAPDVSARQWRRLCECCGDPDCERRLFKALGGGR